MDPAQSANVDFELFVASDLQYSTPYLDFGLENSIISFTIINSGSGMCGYSILPSKGWIDVEPPNGEVSTETDTITVTIDRNALSESIEMESISIRYYLGEDQHQDQISVYVNGVMGLLEEKYYKVVKIGDQIWMAENLNTGMMINIASGSTGDDATNNGVIEKYCYNNSPEYCEEWGALYMRDEACGYQYDSIMQGICPDGWHVPLKSEWYKLFDMYQGKGAAAPALRDTGTIEAGTGKWLASDVVATNESGFSAIPTGVYDGRGVTPYGRIYEAGYGTTFIQITFDIGDQNYISLCYNETGITEHNNSTTGAIRCIKDPD